MTSETVTEVEDDEIAALTAELEKIAATVPLKPDVQALIETLGGKVGYLNHVGTAKFTPDDRERAILLRAADHLQNRGHQGELLSLRQQLITVGNAKVIGYKLTPLGQDFTSYSFDYAIGDRLVTVTGSEYRVTGIDRDDPDVLVVEPWLMN